MLPPFAVVPTLNTIVPVKKQSKPFKNSSKELMFRDNIFQILWQDTEFV